MAENDNPATPEQQLLKLIEGQGGKPGAATGKSTGAPSAKRKGISFGKLPGTLLASLSFWKRSRKKRPRADKGKFSFGIAEINKALMAAAAVLFVYVVYDAAASAHNMQRPPNFAPMKDLHAKAGADSVKPLQEASYYLEKVSSRDIFREGKKNEPAAEAATPASVAVAETAEAVQGLALVGISWSSNPDAIIEDKSVQRTYFVKRGQEVGEGVKVEAIFKDHVVVTYQDREYELR